MNIHVDPASSAQGLQDYFAEGERRAVTLGNRGPLRFGKDGRLDPEIVEIYRRVGLYIFEGVIDPEEQPPRPLHLTSPLRKGRLSGGLPDRQQP